MPDRTQELAEKCVELKLQLISARKFAYLWKKNCKVWRTECIFDRVQHRVEVNKNCQREGRPLIYPEAGLTIREGLRNLLQLDVSRREAQPFPPPG